MKTSSCILGLLGLGWIVYCLFQNVIDFHFGWKPLPRSTYEQRYEGVANPEFEETIRQSESIVDSLHWVSHSPSISIAAMIDGKMIWSYAVGYQDISKKIPATTSTQYRIGSVSKSLTSLALGVAIQNEDIHADSSIQFYTDMFLDKPRISIRQLASHQSGIRNYGVCLCSPIWEYYRDRQFDSITESVEEFENDELLFEPGSDFAYSSYNFTALSLAIEKASKESFTDYMSRHVFEPIGLTQTYPDEKGKYFEHRAVPYDSDKNFFKEAFPVNLSNKWAGGGFLSTPSDLVKVGNVLLHTDFLKEKTVALLTSPQRLNNDSINEQNYGLGWRHDFSERYFGGEIKVEVIHHGGLAVGGTALLMVFPEYEMVIALAMNKSGKQGQFELFDYLEPIVKSFILQIINSTKPLDVFQ